jgi:formamidopyrimidine-DNA glycosylase
MPELPEVEVVRRGLESWVTGQRVAQVEVRGARVTRRQPGGASEFATKLRGAALGCPQRRGKFLWFPLIGRDAALVTHLGMSGQLVLPPASAPDEAHLRVRLTFDGDVRPLRFVDQRTFGWMSVEPLCQGVGGRVVPTAAAAIAIDPLEPDFDAAATGRQIRRHRGPIKAVLLDQQVVSGIGNIYADETLWRRRRHWATPANRLRQSDTTALLRAAAEVMQEALAVGGTSFDSLYVNVNGASGYFARSLDAYGRAGQPCRRCGTTMLRESFGNRSSFRCPRCQRRPPRIPVRRPPAAPRVIDHMGQGDV